MTCGSLGLQLILGLLGCEVGACTRGGGSSLAPVRRHDRLIQRYAGRTQRQEMRPLVGRVRAPDQDVAVDEGGCGAAE